MVGVNLYIGAKPEPKRDAAPVPAPTLVFNLESYTVRTFESYRINSLKNELKHIIILKILMDL
jgi:hypothetical protein